MENKNGSTNQYFRFYMERMKGIEPSRSAWKAEVLPLNYIRISATLCIISFFYFVVKIICVKNPVICFEYSAPSFNILIVNTLRKRRDNMSKLRNYATAIAVPLLLGAAVGFLTMGSMDYDNLNHPPLSPPGILFPIVWTILYILMGVSYGMIRQTGRPESSFLLIYYLQLGVNLLWPIAFFLLKWRLFAFFWIILLDVLVLIMVFKFYAKDRTAGLLQIPYAVWVIFATYLNLGVYLLNK